MFDEEWDAEEDFTIYARKKSGMQIFSNADFERLIPFLKSCVIGQDDVIEKVSYTLINYAKGEGASHALHFVGPTGVGKTELAEVMAKWLYGSRKKVLRVQLANFKEEHSISTLLGAPPGYKGHEKGGLITERAKEGPFLLLLDDVHKGHKNVVEALLQGPCDKNELLDRSTNTKIDMSNVLIVMTSNLGAKQILKAPDRKFEVLRSMVRPIIEKKLCPRSGCKDRNDPLSSDRRL